MSGEQMEKAFHWAKNNCVESDFAVIDGNINVIAKRKKKQTAREFQRLLRTNLINWKVELPEKQIGWLKLITEDEYDELTAATPKQ